MRLVGTRGASPSSTPRSPSLASPPAPARHAARPATPSSQGVQLPQPPEWSWSSTPSTSPRSRSATSSAPWGRRSRSARPPRPAARHTRGRPRTPRPRRIAYGSLPLPEPPSPARGAGTHDHAATPDDAIQAQTTLGPLGVGLHLPATITPDQESPAISHRPHHAVQRQHRAHRHRQHGRRATPRSRQPANLARCGTTCSRTTQAPGCTTAMLMTTSTPAWPPCTPSPARIAATYRQLARGKMTCAGTPSGSSTMIVLKACWRARRRSRWQS